MAQVIVGFTASATGDATGAAVAARRMVLIIRMRVEGTGNCISRVSNKSEWGRVGREVLWKRGSYVGSENRSSEV